MTPLWTLVVTASAALLGAGGLPQSARDLAVRGTELLERGQFEPAARALGEAVRLEPDRGEFQVLLGVAELQRGRADLAVEPLETGARLLPESAEAHYNLGIARFRLDRFAPALEALERAAALDPDDVETEFRRALALAAMSRSLEARKALAALVERAPEHAEAHAVLGRLWLESVASDERRDRAREHLDRALALDPSLVVAKVQRGLLAREEQDLEYAERCFRDALACAPDHIAALYNLGQLLWRSGRKEEGRKLLERFRAVENSTREVERLRRLQRLAPGDAEIAVALARALRAGGDRAAAREELARLLQRAPRHPEALLTSAQWTWEEGDEVRALDEFAKLVRSCPDFARGHEAYGVALCRKGLREQGCAELERALELEPTLRDARRVLDENR